MSTSAVVLPLGALEALTPGDNALLSIAWLWCAPPLIGQQMIPLAVKGKTSARCPACGGGWARGGGGSPSLGRAGARLRGTLAIPARPAPSFPRLRGALPCSARP